MCRQLDPNGHGMCEKVRERQLEADHRRYLTKLRCEHTCTVMLYVGRHSYTGCKAPWRADEREAGGLRDSAREPTCEPCEECYERVEGLREVVERSVDKWREERVGGRDVR